MREELAWAAGFFDGEGTVGYRPNMRGRWYRLQLAVAQSDRRVLDRFRAAFGVGKVYGPYGPYQRSTRQKEFYVYNAGGFEVVQHVIASMWTFLSPVKREQASKALMAARGE